MNNLNGARVVAHPLLKARSAPVKGEADNLLVAIEEAKIRAMRDFEAPPSRVAMHWNTYTRVCLDCRPYLTAIDNGGSAEFNGVKIEIDNSVDGYEFRP